MRRITDQNRAYVEMHGGWGPHLRGVMRADGGSLWFTADAGPDVLNNQSILYFTLVDDAWEPAGTQAHVAGVQQNSASVMSGHTILTYSVNTAVGNLEECYFDTTDTSYFACNTIVGSDTPPNSNYVGAAISSAATRVVWFTVVGGAASGQFIYHYNFGGGWNGPVGVTLAGYNTFEYVRAAFTDDSRIAWNGQLLLGAYPGGTFDPGVAEVDLGDPAQIIPLQGSPGVDVLTGADIWMDPDSGDLHAIAQAQTSGQLAYYVRPAGETWADHDDPIYVWDDTFRARLTRAEGMPLALIRGSSSGASGVDVWLAEPSAAIDWDAATVVEVETATDGLDAPSGIYIEGPAYQTQAVAELNFALCGAYGVSDNEVWHGHLSMR